MNPLVAQPINFSLQEATLNYYLFSFSEQEQSYNLDEIFKVVSLKKGSLLIEGTPQQTLIASSNFISWNHEEESGFSHGQLHFFQNGLYCHGTVSIDSTSAEAQTYTVFGSAVPPSTYKTEITKSRMAAGTDINTIPSGDWESGLELSVGYTYKKGESLPQVDIQMGGQPISDYIGLNIGKEDALIISLLLGVDFPDACTFPTIQALPDFYMEGNITFSTFGDTFSGSISQTCKNGSGKEVFFWKGTATNNRLAQVKSTAFAAEIPTVRPEVITGQNLSIAQLMTLVPNEDVSSASMALLVENMKWAMGGDEAEKNYLKEFFAQVQPTLSPERKAALEPDLAWYQDTFAKAYLTFAFSNTKGAIDPEFQLDKAQMAKLEYFMRDGMAKSTAYVRQTNSLYTEAYFMGQPQLRSYVEDGGEKWAAALFDTLTKPAALINSRNFIQSTLDMSTTNNLSALLSTLSPDSDYAARYQKILLSDNLLNSVINSMVIDEDTAMQWLPDALEAFVEKYENIARDSAGNIQLSDAAKALKDGLKDYRTFAKLAQAMIKVLIKVQGKSLIQQSESAAAAWAREFPELSSMANTFFFFNFVGGLINITISFLDWNKLDPIKKGKLIVSAVSAFGSGIQKGIPLLKERVTLTEWKQLNQWMSEIDQLGTVENILENGNPKWVDVGAQSTAEMFDAGAKVINAEGTRWTKFLTNLDKVLTVVGLLASAAATVLSALNFAKDIRDGKPTSTTVFDGIQTITGGLTVIALTLDLLLTTTVFALAASALAIIGAVVALVQLFMPTPKESLPVNNFMIKTGTPFVDSLPEPPSSFEPSTQNLLVG